MSKWIHASKTVAVRAAIAAGIAAALALCVPPPTEEAPASTVTQTAAEVAGTIRWVSPTQWVALDNAGHTPVGISHVTVLADRVRVHYTFVADKVHVMHVTPDEAFTSASVRCGASVGLTYADVYCYMPGASTPVDPSLLTKANGNIWISGSFLVEEED